MATRELDPISQGVKKTELRTNGYFPASFLCPVKLSPSPPIFCEQRSLDQVIVLSAEESLRCGDVVHVVRFQIRLFHLGSLLPFPASLVSSALQLPPSVNPTVNNKLGGTNTNSQHLDPTKHDNITTTTTTPRQNRKSADSIPHPHPSRPSFNRPDALYPPPPRLPPPQHHPLADNPQRSRPAPGRHHLRVRN